MQSVIDLSYPGIAFASLIGTIIGAFATGYFKTFGKNLATHQDMENMLEQVSATTERTKSIEAAISDDVWDRQRQWEMKRDALFEAVRTLGKLDDALLELYSAYNVELPEDEQKKLLVEESRATRYSNWYEASVNFDAARFLAELVSGKNMNDALDQYIILSRTVSLEIKKGAPASYMDTAIERFKKIQSVYAVIRKELDLEVGS